MANPILTLQDCHKVVKNYLEINDFRVVDYQTSDYFDEVNGFLGEHILLKVKVEVNSDIREYNFFVKRFPFGHPYQSKYLESINGWEREIYFYEDFLEKLQVLPNYKIDFLPKYLLGKKEDIAVFEDLSLKNYSLPKVESLNLLDNEHICLLLQALAKLHAGSLGYEEYKSKQLGIPFRLFKGDEKFVKEPLIRRENNFLGYSWFKGGVKALNALIEIIPRYSTQKEQIKDRFQITVNRALDLMTNLQNDFRNVVSEGDMWAKNVMYQYATKSEKPVHAILVDFQLIRYHVPAHDVLLFIFLTTNTEVRQKYFHYFMKYYHAQLSKALRNFGIDAHKIQMSYDDYLKSVSFILPEIKVQSALQRLQQCGSKEFYKQLLNDKDEFIKFVFVDKTPFALKLFETDANFKKLLTEAVDELVEVSMYPEVFREDVYRFLEEKLGTTDYELLNYEVLKTDEKYLYKLIVHVRIENEVKELIRNVISKPLDYARLL